MSDGTTAGVQLNVQKALIIARGGGDSVVIECGAAANMHNTLMDNKILRILNELQSVAKFLCLKDENKLNKRSTLLEVESWARAIRAWFKLMRRTYFD
jgi:hypothetical protein